MYAVSPDLPHSEKSLDCQKAVKIGTTKGALCFVMKPRVWKEGQCQQLTDETRSLFIMGVRALRRDSAGKRRCQES